MKLAVLTLALALTAPAQTAPPQHEAKPIRSYHLSYAVSMQEQNEILSAIRNVASRNLKIFFVASRNEVVVSGDPEDFAAVEQVLAKLDVPAKLYRLTYIFTETDGGKRIGVQQYSSTLTEGQESRLKEGDRVPVITGSTGENPRNNQTTYLDVGFNFDSTLYPYGSDGVRLKSKIERSSVSDEKSNVAIQDPLIRQTLIEGTTNITLGKPQHLGNIDVIGSTRQLQVDALVEQLR